jgi:NRAMP (natural resistance-associated macrophage protein)-like metal ion transporter
MAKPTQQEGGKASGSETGPPKTLLQNLGPGLITGASDDDPSGIATYAQVGMQFGFGMLWTTLFSIPLMSAVQEVCARLGRITGVGIAANLALRFSKPVVRGLVLLLFLANVFNLGADLAAMGSVAELLTARKSPLFAVGFGALCLLLELFVPYRRYVHYLKWLTLALFAYVAALFVLRIPWLEVLRATFVPSLRLDSSYWMALVAVLGTTISPYLFFWQTSQEAEEIRRNAKESPLKRKPWQAWEQFRRIAFDTRVGMTLSNVVAFSIILTTAVALHHGAAPPGMLDAAGAASALKPIAGNFAFALFALGIIGTGLLAVPVLAGSAAYAVAEIFGWRATLESKPRRAPQFYLVLSLATILGVSLTFFGLDPMRALYWSAMLNGVAAAPLMAALMKLANDPHIVKQFRLPGPLRVLGWVATAVMFAASVALVLTALAGKKG